MYFRWHLLLVITTFEMMFDRIRIYELIPNQNRLSLRIAGVEMVGRKKREMSGIILNYFYAVGEALTGIIAWISGDWVTLQFLISVPPLLFIVYYW